MTSESAMPRPLVTSEWLHRHIDAPDIRVVDCSVVMRTTDDGGYTFVGGHDEWRAGHIPGAGFVDVLQELADKSSTLPMMMPPAEQFAEVMARLGIGRSTRTVLYDRSNHAWAARVWWMLRVHGYDDAAVLDGGFNKWSAEGRPVTDEPPSHAPGRFEVRLRPELIATRDRVLSAIDEPDAVVVNALSPEEHAGATSRFPRSGRIAGSVNVYCQSLVDPNTHAYLPTEELRKRFNAAGVDKGARVITYCGAGIAASSDALALTLIGLDDVAVYDGSLAEWTTDASLPMEAD